MHLAHHGVVDALLGLGSGRDVEAHHIAGLEEGIAVGDGVNASLFNLLGGDELVESVDIHAKAFGDAGHVATHVAEGQQTELLAHQFAAALAVVEVTDGIDQHAHDEFGNGVAVLARGVHGDDATGGASLEVEVVVTGTGADDDLQVLGVVDDFLRHLVGTHDEGVGVGNGGIEVVHVGIFLEESQLVTVLFDDFSNSINSNLCERFFSCN